MCYLFWIAGLNAHRGANGCAPAAARGVARWPRRQPLQSSGEGSASAAIAEPVQQPRETLGRPTPRGRWAAAWSEVRRRCCPGNVNDPPWDHLHWGQHFGFILDHLIIGILVGSCWDYFWITLHRGALGIIWPSPWDRCGINLESCWDHLGISLLSSMGVPQSHPWQHEWRLAMAPPLGLRGATRIAYKCASAHGRSRNRRGTWGLGSPQARKRVCRTDCNALASVRHCIWDRCSARTAAFALHTTS